MRRETYVLSATTMAIGLVAAACSGIALGAPSSDLQSLIVAPANTQRTDGPDPVQENGIHEHFLVNGAPTQVMDSYRNDLQGKGWSLTVQNSSGGGGGGGATYTGTNGSAYGVFTGGGYGATTDVDACAWPSKPSNTNCGHH